MYFFTDDDLRRVDRTFLGPKNKRLPLVLTYRQWGVAFTYIGLVWIAFMWLGIPFGKYQLIVAGFAIVFLCVYTFRRMDGSVSLWAAFKTGWQEVSVPRKKTGAKQYEVKAHILRYSSSDRRVKKWYHRLFDVMFKGSDHA